MAGSVLATLIVKIGAQVEDVKKGVDKVTRDLEGVKQAADRIDKAVESSFSNMAKSAASMAAGLFTAEVALRAVSAVADTVVGAVKSVAGAFVDAVKQTVDLGDTLFGLSQKTGISVEALSALRFAAGQTNTSLETITNAVFKMQTSLGKGGEATARAVSQLGLSLRDLRTSDPADAFTKILDALGKIPNATQRAALGAQIFGRQFKDIAQLTQEDLGKIVEQARRVGAVMSTETAVAADRFNDALATLTARAEGFAIKIGSAVLPGLIAFVETLNDAFTDVTRIGGASLDGLATLFDAAVVSIGRSVAKLVGILALMAAEFSQIMTDMLAQLTSTVSLVAEITRAASLLASVVNPTGLTAGATGAVDTVANRIKLALDAALQSSAAVNKSIQSIGLTTALVANKAGESFGQVFERVKAEIAKAAAEMRKGFRGVGEFGADAVSDIVKAFEKLQDKVRGVDIIKQAKAWELALQDPMNVVFTFADRALSTELRDALDAIVIKFGDLKTAGVGSMEAIHNAIRQRLLPSIREGLEGIKQLPGQLLTIFDALRPGVLEGVPGALRDVGRTGILPTGFAETITHPIRDAFADLGRDLPQLIFGAIESGQSVIGTVASAAATRFMSVFNQAVARIAKTPGGGALTAGEKFAGLAGVGLASLANGIALGGGQSLVGGALSGAASGALLGVNPALSGPTLGASIAIGAGVGLVGGLIGAVKGKKQEQLALQQMKAQFEAQFGGLNKLRELAEKANLDLDEVFNAKKPEQFNKAVQEVNRQLERYNKRLEGLQTALTGVNQRALVFANNFADLIRRRNELGQGGEGGAELDSINAKIAEVAQRTQPEFERLGIMVRDTFAGLVRESGDAFQAITALAPAFQVLQDGVDHFGLTSTAAIDELLANFRLINDETLGPFLQNIQASGQVLKGLFDAKALSPEGFQAIAADIGQSFQEIANRGGDITRALALNQPVLQKLWEAQQRFGQITDQTTQSILRQAEEQGLVGAHMKDVNDKILDVLIAIADVFGAKIPEALRNTQNAVGGVTDAVIEIGDVSNVVWHELARDAQNAANSAESAFDNIKIPKITIPVQFDADGLPIPDPDRLRAFDVPGLASGGLVRRPTLAVVGEAGPEVVIPLERLAAGAEGSAQATVVFERGAFEGIVVDNEERVEQLAARIFTAVRRGGRVRSTAIGAGFTVR